MAGKKRTTTVTADTLLFELGTEELPPKALRRLSTTLGEALYTGLARAKLTTEASAEYAVYATPRRLAVSVPGVRARQPDQEIERRGPALKAAFDDFGAPTQAALGFARSCGVTPDRLARLETDKGAWLVFRSREKGQAANKLIPDLVDAALKQLPIPKRMRWSDLDAEFVRPVHWIVLMHGAKVIKTRILSVVAGTTTRGHRFHSPRPITLRTAGTYADALEKRGQVIADFSARRAQIAKQVERLANQVTGQAILDDDLLDEVTGLVEWPVAVRGEFDKAFLKVPPEVLRTTMQDNQKYFPVTNRRGRLLPFFVTVSNIKSKNARKVREGNERVLRARFADARFFWESDRKLKLEDRVTGLKDVVFHVKLGSLADKVARVTGLTKIVATGLDSDVARAARAAHLAKADLMSGMVGEFPSLQGVMGRYYAKHDGEHADVVAAMAEQYLPRFAGDELPRTDTGRALAIADRLDTLVGIFGIGEVPSGDKDPFGLRRAALGVLRIMIEGELSLDLRALLKEAVDQYQLTFEPGGVIDDVYAFMMERLRAYYQDDGVAPDVFESVIACQPAEPHDLDRRIRAVSAFRQMPQAESLAAANKRIRNILRQAGGVGKLPPDAANRLQEKAERQLADALADMETVVSPLFDARDYTPALKKLARLRTPVDTFFDDVMVMVDDVDLRNARLDLLNRLSQLFLRVADISRLQG